MKQLLLFVWLFFLLNVSYAQLENSNWCFGNHSRLSFNPVLPNSIPIASSSSVYNNLPGSGGYSGSGSSVSDANGQMLFYTDALSVWDKNNNEMPNGQQLFGTTDNVAGKNNSVIVPKPDHSGYYYIITISTFVPSAPGFGHGGVHYSVVNMNLPGTPGPTSGNNGDVVSGLKNITLNNNNNIPLDYDFSTNTGLRVYHTKIATTLHKDKDKVWVSVFTHYVESGIDHLYSFNYLITANGFYDGVNYYPDGSSPKPVTSFLRSNSLYNPDIGSVWAEEIKFSSDGLYLAENSKNCLVLYDFDNSSGVMSYNRTVFVSGTGNPWNAYCADGVEFAPHLNPLDNQYLYFSTSDFILQERQNRVALQKSKKYVRIFQYGIKTNITVPVGQYEIPDSTVDNVITPIPNSQYSVGLQLGIDNKIYAAVNPPTVPYCTWLGIIQQPDIEETTTTTCDFILQGVQLQWPTYHLFTLPHWVHRPTIHIWPKVYEAVEPGGGVKLDNNGNILCGFNLNNMANNINHDGVIDNTANIGHTIHYKKSNGITDWVSQNWWYSVFTSNASTFTQFSLSGSSIYRNTTTGNLISGPNYVPRDQPIVAEDNGAFVTSFIDHTGSTMIDQLWVHAPFSVHNSITIPCISGYYVGINKIVFNPVTKRLFMYYTNNKIVGNIQKKYLAIYTLSNNALINPLHYLIDYPIVGINSLEEVFVLDNTGAVLKYDYINNAYSPLAVSNNNSLTSLETLKQIVEDKIILANFNTSEIYCFNTNPSVLTAKKISATLSSTNSNPYLTSYFIDANYVYLTGGFNTPTFSIGNQTMPLLGNMSSFITKFNVVSDFSFRSVNEDFSTTKPSSSFFERPTKGNEEKPLNTNKPNFTFSLTPNPVKQKISINLLGGNKINFLSHKISIANAEGTIVLTQVSNQSLSLVDVSKLSTGIYYLTISNSNGDKSTKLFLKEE